MIQSYLDYLRIEKRYSEKTVIAYQTDLNQFSNFSKINLQLEDLNEATYQHIRSWLLSMIESGIQPVSINRKMATLRNFYKFLIRFEHIVLDPCLKIKSLKTQKSIPDFVPEEDILKLLEYNNGVFKESVEGLRDKMVFELFYGTGIRLSELINLKTKDIDLYNQRIKVLGKRNKERLIPFNLSLRESVKVYNASKAKEFEGKESEYFIVLNDGSQVYPMFVYRLVKKYLDQFTTIDKRSPHVLRHTFATHLLARGADLNAVKDLLGHESLSATEVYTHHTLGRLKEIFDQAHPKAK